MAWAFLEDRDAMMDHLEKNHDLDVTVRRVNCPICVEYSSDDRDALALHFSRHMEEIALAILPSGVDADDKSASDASSEADSESLTKVGGKHDKESVSIASSQDESESEKHTDAAMNPSDQVATEITETDASKTRLAPGTEVLYRDPRKRTNTEGEGILCRVTAIIGEGKQRRYEIIDADPDPPTPAIPYRASINHLVPIPPTNSNMTLPKFDRGTNVIALYPETTTFYNAVVLVGKAKEENMVRLNFEGEDEEDRDRSVERRYILSVDKHRTTTSSRGDAPDVESNRDHPPEETNASTKPPFTKETAMDEHNIRAFP